MNYSSTKILLSERNLNERFFLELAFIAQCDNCLKKDQT